MGELVCWLENMAATKWFSLTMQTEFSGHLLEFCQKDTWVFFAWNVLGKASEGIKVL